MLIPFGDPAHAEDTGITHAGIRFFNIFGLQGISKTNLSTGFYSTGTEHQGNSDISMGTVWTGTGNQDLFGNCLDGTTGTLLAREREKSHFP